MRIATFTICALVAISSAAASPVCAQDLGESPSFEERRQRAVAAGLSVVRARLPGEKGYHRTTYPVRVNLALDMYTLLETGTPASDPLLRGTMIALRKADDPDIWFSLRNNNPLIRMLAAHTTLAAVAYDRALLSEDPRAESKQSYKNHHKWVESLVSRLSALLSPDNERLAVQAGTHTDGTFHLALVALLEARDLGLHVEDRQLARWLSASLASQVPADRRNAATATPRGFSFLPTRPQHPGARAALPSSSMTGGALAAITRLIDALGDSDLLTDALAQRSRHALEDGLLYIERSLADHTDPRLRGEEHEAVFAYFYSLACACDALSLDLLGRYDWYRDGADYLLATQDADGSWFTRGHRGNGSADCWALLFLTRSLPHAGDRPAITRSSRGVRDVEFASVRERPAAERRAFVRSLVPRLHDATTRQRPWFFAEIARLGVAAADELVDIVDVHAEPDVRAAAYEILRHVIEPSLDLDPRATLGRRHAQIAAWRAWIDERRARLAYDHRTGRLVEVDREQRVRDG